MCFGPDASEAMNGSATVVSSAVESSHFAFSAASLRRWRARRSWRRSIPLDCRNSARSQSMIARSKSSPPRKVSPDVERTSNIPLSILRIEMSNVPPPRS